MAKSFPKRDAFLRLDFLHQASHLLVKQLKLKNTQMTKHIRYDKEVGGNNLLRFYGESFANISKRNVLKVHPEVKRVMCKRCRVLLVPGVTSRVRTRSKKLVVRCLSCNFSKCYPTNPSHCLWLDHEKALHKYESQHWKKKNGSGGGEKYGGSKKNAGGEKKGGGEKKCGGNGCGEKGNETKSEGGKNTSLGDMSNSDVGELSKDKAKKNNDFYINENDDNDMKYDDGKINIGNNTNQMDFDYKYSKNIIIKPYDDSCKESGDGISKEDSTLDNEAASRGTNATSL